jgi:DMSO/TMAO reductase YedYZ molybdopterin-dependent catalytic subunit
MNAMTLNSLARGRGFLAGVLAAATMTLVMVVLRLTTDVLSLPEILGEAIITLMPAAIFSAALDLMQRAAKPTLYLSILLGIVLVGGLLGRWYAAGEQSWSRAVKLALVMWLVFGVLVLPALGVGLFASVVRAGPVAVAIQLLVAFGTFAVALVLIERALSPAEAAPAEDIRNDRRAALLKIGAGVAAVAVGGITWRSIAAGQTVDAAAATAAGSTASSSPASSAPAATDAPPAVSAVDPPKRGIPPLNAPAVPMTVAPNAPAPAPFAVASMTPEVLTAKDFYTVSKNLLDPTVEMSTWSLRVDGLVERPTTYTYPDITAMATHSDYYTLQCISNLVGGDLWGNAHWKGVRLVDILTRTGLRPGVRDAVFHAADDYTDSIPIDVALRPDTLLAYEMNGEPLTKEHGYPARLLIPGIYGMKNVKWITRIELVDYDYKGYWMQRGWSDKATYQTSSRIDVPRNRATLPTGEVEIAGVAFAGDRGIDKVEVSFDDGATWEEARIKPALSNNAWNLWVHRKDLAAGAFPLKVRAIDGNGQLQTDRPSDPLPDGATGYHSVLLRVG